jgi:hypothetical protein
MGWVYATETDHDQRPANRVLQVIVQMKRGAQTRRRKQTRPRSCSRMPFCCVSRSQPSASRRRPRSVERGIRARWKQFLAIFGCTTVTRLRLISSCLTTQSGLALGVISRDEAPATERLFDKVMGAAAI